MFIKGFLLILLAIILAIATIIFLILAIIKRTSTLFNMRYFWAFLCSLTCTFIITVYLLVKIFLAGINYGKTVIDDTPNVLTSIISDVLSSSYPMDTPQMKMILALQPDSISIPGEYYTYAGFRDYYRMPLVYPYSMNAIDAVEDGHIEDETGVHILTESNKAPQMLHGITHFSFNNKVLYATIHGHFDTQTTYAVLHFQTKEIEKFETQEEALSTAHKAGLDPNNRMWEIKEYYWAFSNYE